MPAGLSIAIALLVQAAASVPAAEPQASPPPPAAAGESCRTATPSADATEIVVCAERPKGYRIDPDVRTAKRHARSRPQRRSNQHMKDMNCGSVGPGGCIAGPGINLPSAVLTAVTMVDRAVRGENVGDMFITRPETSEYDYYVAAKRRREAEEAEAAAKVKAAAAATAAQSAPKP